MKKQNQAPDLSDLVLDLNNIKEKIKSSFKLDRAGCLNLISKNLKTIDSLKQFKATLESDVFEMWYSEKDLEIISSVIKILNECNDSLLNQIRREK